MKSLEAVRRTVDPFFEELMQEYYLNLSGQKDVLNTSTIYDKYASLFDMGTLETVKREKGREEGSDGRKRRLRYLLSFLVSGFLERKVRELTDRAETASSKEVVRFGGKEVPFRLSFIRMVQERERAKRAEIDEARNRKVEEAMNPILEPRLAKLHEAAKEVGYPSYASLFDDIKNLRLRELQNSAEKILSRTNEVYCDKMDKFLRKKVGLTIEEAEKHDISHLLRAMDFDSFFPKEGALPLLTKTLSAMGFNLQARKNIFLDLDQRVKKSPRAFVAPIRVPDKVVLVLMPRGGLDDYSTLLHEAGHAMHFSSTKGKNPVEYRRLGDISVSETFAFLFQYLMTNKAWVKTNLSLGGANEKDYMEFRHIEKLYFLRRYSAKLSYETKLHSAGKVDDFRDFREIYRESLESALKFKHPPSHFLMDVDDGFYVAQYLRAWIFEAQLRRRLVELFGEHWFLKAEAGKFLERLWSVGEKYEVVELGERIGCSRLDEGVLIDELNSSWNW